MWTLVALLRVVCLQMSHLGGGVREGLLTEVAVVRLLAAVHQLVALQVSRCGEELATHFAAVPCLTCVPFAVQVEQADLSVALSTGRAAVWLQRAGEMKCSKLVWQLTELSRYLSVKRNAGVQNVCDLPVCFLMGFTGCRVRKSLVAVSTAEWLFSCVNAHVSLEITSVGEFLPTVLKK